MIERATVTLEVPLAELDPEVAEALDLERKRQQNTLEMIASENFVPRAVLQGQGSVLTNKYAEGYPGRRTTAVANSSILLKTWLLSGSRNFSVPSTPTCSPTPVPRRITPSCTPC